MKPKTKEQNAFGVWVPFQHGMEYLHIADFLDDERADAVRFAHVDQLKGIHDLLKARQLTIQTLLEELGPEAQKVHNKHGKIRIWALHPNSLDTWGSSHELAAPSLKLGISSIKFDERDYMFDAVSALLIIR